MAEFVSADPNGLEAHQQSPYRHLWWLVLLGIAGCIIYFTKNDEVFAAASLNLSMPKDQIVQKAAAWAVKLGYNPEPSARPSAVSSQEPKSGELEAKSPAAETQRALKSITFSYDNDAKSFLEYELGVRKANELMKSEIPVWYWRVRMVRELQQEELRVFMSPDGKLSGLGHDFENDKSIPSLTHKEAEAFARNFVEKETGNSLEGFDLIKDEERKKPKRTDHTFTFEDTRKDFKGAKMRVLVGLAGNQIDSYNRYLHVPEAWERKFEDIRSYNMMLAKIAQIFMTLLMLVSIFTFGWAVMTGNIRWVPVVVIALVYSVFPSLDSINNFNEIAAGYNTNITYNSYISTELLKLLAAIVPNAFSAIVLFGAAEALYRKTFPDHIAVEKILTADGVKSKAVRLALLVGQLLFMIDLGWVVFYYLVGQKIGFWCPLGVENYEILSSFVPAISAMHVGVTASFMEEALYRVIGMSLMMRISGNFWVANLFQAAAWGFAHSSYPQQPFYARGVELTIGGLLDGWILRRYGILACVASHYVFDTFLGVKPLFSSGDTQLRATALLSVIPFLVLLACGTLSSRRVKDTDTEPKLLNRAINETIHVKELDESEPEEKPISYTSIVPQGRLFLFIATVVIGLASFVIRPQIINSDATVHIERHQAESVAAKVLSRHGIEAPGYTVVSYLTEQGANEPEQYLFEKVGFAKTREIVKKSHSDGFCWHVRFFKPKTPEEYEVQLDGDGREIGFDVQLAEETAGAFLAKDEALQKVHLELDSVYPYLQPYELESASEQKRPARTDWTFVFRSRQFDAADARFKTNMTVYGDIVSGATWAWEVPDKWTFDRQKRSVREELASNVYTGGAILVFILGAVWIIGVLYARAIKIRPALIIGVIYTLTLIPEQLNTLPLLFASYTTTTPINNFLTDVVSQYAQAYLRAFWLSSTVAAFAIASLRILFPQVRLSNYFTVVLRPHNKENQSVQRRMWVDGALAGYAFVAFYELILVATGMLRVHFSPEIQQSSLNTVATLMNLQFPPLESLVTAPVQGVQQLFITAIAVGFYARYCRSAKVYFALILLVSLGSWFGTKHLQDAVIGFLSTVATYTLNWFFIAKIAKTNPVAYFTAGLSSVLFARILSIVFHGLPVMLPTLAVSAVLLAGPAIVAAILSTRSEMPSSVVTAIAPKEPAEIEPTAPEAAEIGEEVREETSNAADRPETD
jgi:hypothetical protein